MGPKPDPGMDQFLDASLKMIQKDYPELWSILETAKQKNQLAPETVIQIQDYLQAKPTINESLQKALDPEQSTKIARSQEHGLPRLNPLVEAALIERLQFDQDIPELRSGPAPKKVSPAVPVETQSRNPVALGNMLKSASKGMRKKLDKLAREHRIQANEVLAENPKALAIISRHGEMVAVQDKQELADLILYGSQETDIPGYRRGELPVPVKVKNPTGATLLKMTPKEQRENAWTFLSTTHGRRTAIPVIRGIIAEQLRKRDLQVTEQDYKPESKHRPLVVHEWRVSLSGESSIQPAMSLIDMSARALAAGLIKYLPKTGEPLLEVILEVTSIDQFSERQVGWAARLLPHA